MRHILGGDYHCDSTSVRVRFRTFDFNNRPRHDHCATYVTTVRRYRNSILLVLDGQAVFTQKVFGPRTAKSQQIWIKFRTHLLLYGTHLWADLDRDRCMGGSRPSQNDSVFFCNTCKLLSPIETTTISAANRQSGREDRWYRERFRNFVPWTEPDPKNSIFSCF